MDCMDLDVDCPKKAIKLNHSLTIWWRRSRTPLTSDVLITTVSVKRYRRAPVYDLHCGAAVDCCISEDHLFHCWDVWPLGGATGAGDITSSGDGWPLPCPFRCLPTSSSCRLWSRPVTIWKSRLTVLFDWALISVKSIRLTAYVLTLITKFAWITLSSSRRVSTCYWLSGLLLITYWQCVSAYHWISRTLTWDSHYSLLVS